MHNKMLRHLCMLALCGLLGLTAAKDNLHVAYEWREIDFKYANSDQRWADIESGKFKPANVIPFGLEVYGTRLFITLPRWRNGVPASLAYLDLNDTSTIMPALTPFPSWEAHSLSETEPELVSPFRVRADRCGRLWVLDARISSVLEQTKLYGAAQLLIYDLHNDDLLRRHVFPAAQTKQNSFFANLAIEDVDCENTYAYAADLGSPGLVVYSWRQQESWRVQHHFFHPDPMAGNFSVNGIEFQWDDGLYGLALSNTHSDGFATLYFHPLSSTMEFSVNTAVLRNKTLATHGEIYKKFNVLGARGTNAQAGASWFDTKTHVLFYTLPNLNAVGCWKTTQQYTDKLQGRIQMSDNKLVFPSDIKVDSEQRLWVMSNQLSNYIYDELYPGSVNFHILMGNVQQAIADTPCDVKEKPVPPELIHKLNDILDTANGIKAITKGSGAANLKLSYFLAACSCLLLIKLL